MFIACVAAPAVPAHASDDSNGGQLVLAPTVSAQQLNTALTALEQGNNDTLLRQLLTGLQAYVGEGNYAAASSTLAQLQTVSANDANRGRPVSPALGALINSLSVGSDGASVNSNALASALKSDAAAGGSAASQQKLSVDEQILADLMQYANSTLASDLLQSSDLLSQKAFAGTNASAGIAPVALPGTSGFSGLSIPSLGVPSLSVGNASGGLPTIPLAALVVPLVVVGAIAALFVSRRRLVGLVGSRSLPGMKLLRGAKGRERSGRRGRTLRPPGEDRVLLRQGGQADGEEGRPEARVGDPPRVLLQVRGHSRATARRAPSPPSTRRRSSQDRTWGAPTPTSPLRSSSPWARKSDEAPPVRRDPGRGGPRGRHLLALHHRVLGFPRRRRRDWPDRHLVVRDLDVPLLSPPGRIPGHRREHDATRS